MYPSFSGCSYYLGKMISPIGIPGADELTISLSREVQQRLNKVGIFRNFDEANSTQGELTDSPSKWHTLKALTMASSSTQPGATLNELILTPIMTLKGHEPFNCYYVSSMCYFPDGKQMISGLGDKTPRRWDLRAGKEIEEAREVCEQKVRWRYQGMVNGL